MRTHLSRRDLLRTAACGFGHLALAGLAAGSGAASSPRSPHFAPKAKRIIFLFMQGGVSQVDSFDHKPRLARDDGRRMPFEDARILANTGQRESTQRVLSSPWKFRRHGECGRWASDLFPEIASRVDDLCFLHAVTTEGVAHGPATLFLHCGASTSVRPAMGSWVLYGLGTENENLPGFLSIAPSSGNGGARNHGSAFLPAAFQGTPLGRAGAPVSETTIRDLHDPLGEDDRRDRTELIRRLNAAQFAAEPGETEQEAVIASYELAGRMQAHAPALLDLGAETDETRALYGIGEAPTDAFGRQCLLARRFSEAGVRFIQVTYGDGSANPAFDQHSNLPRHADHARAVDRPVAGLLADLERRGLLEDTLVWWGSEFGRTPYAEKNGTGRDHNPGGFTVWLAGAGVKPGFAHGATDEFGHLAVEGRVHMHDLHATILHLLGLDHERLTYSHDGREYRLTDVHGRVVEAVLS